jgi:hypothetical protein
MSRQLLTLLALTLGAFVLVEGVRLVTGQGWSWVWAIGFGFVVLIQLVALASEQRSN